MTESILLPTRKDEAWRYSDIDAIQETAPETFEAWEDIRVAEGESWRDLILLDGSDGLTMRRLRIVLEKGARAVAGIGTAARSPEAGPRIGTGGTGTGLVEGVS